MSDTMRSTITGVLLTVYLTATLSFMGYVGVTMFELKSDVAVIKATMVTK